MKKLTRKNKILFSAIVSICVALSLVFPTFAATPTVYQVSSYQTGSYSDDNGNTIYTYDLSTSSYLHKYVLGVKGTSTGIYSIFNWNGNTQYPFMGTWNATYSGDLASGVLPPVYNFGSFMAGNTVTLTFALKLNTLANIQGYCSFYLFLSNTYMDFTDIWDGISLDPNTGRVTGNLKDINAVVDSKTINLSDIQNGETYCTVTFDFAIDTFQGNLFPTIGFFIPSNVSGQMYSLGCEISRTYPTSGIILENTDTIIEELGEQNEYIEQISGDLTIVKASLDTVKSTLSTISSRINTTNTRLNTLHNDISNLHNDLFTGEDIEFNTEETLPAEDYENAFNSIDDANSDFQDFWHDWILNSHLGSWFSQFWDTLLDSSNGGTPFLLLPPAALLLIIRSLFGR